MTAEGQGPSVAQPTDEDTKALETAVDLAKAVTQDELDLDEETAKKLYAELLSLATQSVDRSRKSAELVQAAAVAVGGLYTGILGFIFVAKDNPMPWRGIWPTLFLGLAVVLAMSYVAFITRTPGVAQPKAPANDDAEQRLIRRAYFYTQITRALVQQRAHQLRAAVVSLGVGVVLLPLPFLEIGDMSLPFLGTASPAPSVSASISGAPTASGGARPSVTASPMPSASVAAASAEPWPTPQFTEPRALAAILYQAQVEAYTEDLAADGGESQTSDSDAAENWMSILLAAAGAILVLRAIRNQWPFGDPLTGGAGT